MTKKAVEKPTKTRNYLDAIEYVGHLKLTIPPLKFIQGKSYVYVCY